MHSRVNYGQPQHTPGTIKRRNPVTLARGGVKKNNLKKDFTKERKKSISKKNHWGGENSLITHKIFNEMIYFKSLDYFTSKT